MATTVQTIEQIIDALHRTKGKMNSALSLLGNLRTQRDQLFAKQLDAQDVDAAMVDNLAEVSNILDQVRTDIVALGNGTMGNAATIFNAIEIRPGQRSDKDGTALQTELSFWIIDADNASSGATLSPRDAASGDVKAFKDGGNTLLVDGDKVELYNAENPENNGINEVAACTDILLTLDDPIVGGVDNSADSTLRIRKIEDQA